MTEIPLPGGDVTEGVVRVGATVRRPTGPNAPMIHAFLEHLDRVGFDGAPGYLGLDPANREILDFIDGEVAGRPRPSWIADEDRLVSLARLLRRFDDAAASFCAPPELRPDWGVPELAGMPADPEPIELIGHQDITCENVVFVDGSAAALIDFDLIKPTSRLGEVINALIWWAPLADREDRDPLVVDVDVPRRCRVFADAYGLDTASRARLVSSTMIKTERSWHLMRHRATTFGGGWARMWDEGVGDVIRRRARWLQQNGPQISAALLTRA